MPQPRHSREEFARRGQEIYDRAVRPALQPADEGKFVAIDIESGAFALDLDDFLATERVLQHHPDAQLWLMQVGQPAAYRLGAHSGMPTS